MIKLNSINSGERLSENTNSENLRKIIRDSISNQKRKTVTVLSSLLAVQDKLHYIPDEAVEEISIHCKLQLMMFGVLHPFIQTLDLLPLEIKPLMFVGDLVVILMELKISLIKLTNNLE